MLTNKKYSGRMPLVVVAALLSLMIMLPLAGCKNDTVPPEVAKQEQADGGGSETDKDDTAPEPTNQEQTGDSSGGVGTDQEPTQYTVTFNANGGSAVAPQTVESGQTATKPADPTLEGSWFLGWYSDEGLAKKFDFNTPITATTTVYAKWSYKLHTEPTKLTGYTSPNHTGSEWTYVAFGDWPQTIMADGVTVDETKSKTMGMFTYYLGSDGNHYVKQVETAYESGYKYSDDSDVKKDENTTRWFKVEPIVWRVLTKDYKDPDGNSTNKALLLAEKILTGGIKWSNYSNNYQDSNIRKWLNGNSGTEAASDYSGDPGFLQNAFAQSARNLIADTTVDNSAASTTDAGNKLDQATDYACANTTDKVFLLSEAEATTSEYGFAVYSKYGTGSTRIRVTTDYAKATGAYQPSTEGYGGWWWLRSPSCSGEFNADNIYSDGNGYNFYFVDGAGGGVVPALSISLQ